MFENVIKEIDGCLISARHEVRTIFKEKAQEIFIACAPHCIFCDTEPALLLQEIKKHNLPQQLLGKISALNKFKFEFRLDRCVLLDDFFKRCLCPLKQVFVLREEIFRDLFNFESVFEGGPLLAKQEGDHSLERLEGIEYK